MTEASSDALQELAGKYASLLQAYVRTPSEDLRERAYQFAYEAIADGHGVLDVMAAHREALLKMLDHARTRRESEQIAERASEFLLESLVPFEMTHRGYKESLDKLTAVSEALRKARDELEERVEERTAELAKANVELQAEIAERRQAQEERERLLGKVEHLAAEAQRRAAELQGVLDNMVDAVYVCNIEGRITLANEAALLLTGLANLEEIKRTLAEFPDLLHMRHLDGKPIVPQELPLARALSGETVESDDEVLFNPRTQQDVYVRASAAPIRDEKGTIVGAVAVARDVTELIEVDRLKNQFISVAAHELKTPVTGIKGYAQLLLRWEHEGVSPRGLIALQAINRQADRISRLVNELLEVSRIQTGHLELHLTKFDLSQVAAEAVERMKLTTEKHTLLFQSPGPVFVEADRDRIEQVLNTLLDNAIKFSPQGGNVETTIHTVDGEAVVSVRDYGVGIPKDRQARMFERFYRAHAGTPYDYGGTGIGLHISKEIVERHGGRMWFESEEGKGSTFCFSLPLQS